MNMKELRASARDRMKGYCRVCPVCDGRACAGEVPGMGGLGTGGTFTANIEALRRIRLKARLIHHAAMPDTSCEVLGFKLAFPILAAPIGGISFNMGGALEEAEYCTAVINGCKECGVIGSVGDGVPPVIIDSALNAVKAAGGHGIPFIKPWADEELYAKLARAADTGCTVMGIDIDAVGLITLAKMGRPVMPRNADALRIIIDHVHDLGMKCILKGIMCEEDAAAAESIGCDAVVVSNHGGRVLDSGIGTAEVLKQVAAASGAMAVIADSGVRSGVDVLKLLALGAQAVMVGRPISIGAIGGEKDGVKLTLETMRSELVAAMVLTGCSSVADITADILV